MNIAVVTPPAAAPVSVSEAKSHLRIASGFTTDDTDIGRYIDAATNLLEGPDGANRAFVNRTIDLFLDNVDGDRIDLPRVPVASVTGVFVTTDDDVEHTLSADTDYRVSLGKGCIVRRRGATWNVGTLSEVDAWRVRYVAGYGADGDAVPEAIRQAILVQVAEWYENRGDEPDVGTGSTASQGASLVLGKAAQSIIVSAGLRRYVL